VQAKQRHPTVFAGRLRNEVPIESEIAKEVPAGIDEVGALSFTRCTEHRVVASRESASRARTRAKS
jgi:hypothetical protein